MRNAFRHFWLGGCAAGLLAAGALGSASTFSLKMAGIQKVDEGVQMFVDIACVTDDDCPAGSQCLYTEVVFPTHFEWRCGPIADAPEGFVQAGDNIVVHAYVKGWDDDPETGFCENRDECNIALNDCQYKHCEDDERSCVIASDCLGDQRCVPDTCAAGPLLGAEQWTVDVSTYASRTVPAAGDLHPAILDCTHYSSCRHGAQYGSQCTCFEALCLTGKCTVESIAYLWLIDFSYLFYGQSHLKTIQTCDYPDTVCDYAFSGVLMLGGLVDEGKDHYVGSLWLGVPEDAAGRYEVSFVDSTNHTFVTDDGGRLMDQPQIEPLVLNIADPCEDYTCPDPPNVCQEYVCIVVDGSPTCVREPITCEDPCDKCVIAEGGCVSAGACCVGENCSIKSELQCTNAGGWSWDYCAACEPETCVRTGACCTDGVCTVVTEDECNAGGGTYQGDDVPCDPDPCDQCEAVASTPADGGTLWRSQKNVLHVEFSTALAAAPTAADVEIVELMAGCVEGSNLSASFTYSVDGTILTIQDTGANLEHRKWYRFRTNGWGSCTGFEYDFLVQVCDADGDGKVLNFDTGVINAAIPCFMNCDERLDCDGDGKILNFDTGITNANIPSFPVAHPCP